MGDEHHDTIPEKEPDEFKKSSIENLVPSPSESEDEHECDLPLYDDFTTFSNLLFDADDDFSSTITITLDLPTVEPEDSLRMGDEHHDTIPEKEPDEFKKSSIENLVPSPSESEDEHECDLPLYDDFTTFSNLLFDADDDFSSKFISENSDATIEYFSPSPILFKDSNSFRDEIDLSLTPDDSMPPSIEDDDYDSEGDIFIFEELLSNDSLSLPKN
nr:hypothetical protein [Tanacetum cinerariifolium]